MAYFLTTSFSCTITVLSTSTFYPVFFYSFYSKSIFGVSEAELVYLSLSVSLQRRNLSKKKSVSLSQSSLARSIIDWLLPSASIKACWCWPDYEPWLRIAMILLVSYDLMRIISANRAKASRLSSWSDWLAMNRKHWIKSFQCSSLIWIVAKFTFLTS